MLNPLSKLEKLLSTNSKVIKSLANSIISNHVTTIIFGIYWVQNKILLAKFTSILNFNNLVRFCLLIIFLLHFFIIFITFIINLLFTFITINLHRYTRMSKNSFSSFLK